MIWQNWQRVPLEHGTGKPCLDSVGKFMLLGWLEGQRGSQGEVCSYVETDILRVPHHGCISQLLHGNTFLDRGTPLLHMLVSRSDDELRNARLSVVCCFVFPCELSTEWMQNSVVTLPVRLSRGLLPFLSSMKFLLPRKTRLQFCLTDWDGMVYSWLSKSSCSMGFLVGEYLQCGKSMVHTV